jgi:Overcoming lysogenization defect protein-like, TOPRIM domain
MESRRAAVIAVEGNSDKVVLETISRRLGRDLGVEGITIQAIGGAHAIRRFVSEIGSGVAVRGLCDENEQHLFRRVLDEVYVCVPDLEGELIRALGVERMLEIVDRDAFATMQRQPAQRGRPIELQLHRWLRASSSRYHRYLPVLADALELDRVPAPLAGVLR